MAAAFPMSSPGSMASSACSVPRSTVTGSLESLSGAAFEAPQPMERPVKMQSMMCERTGLGLRRSGLLGVDYCKSIVCECM